MTDFPSFVECWLFRYDENLSSFCIRISNSQKCDGFMVASTKTDKGLGTVNIPHEGPEEYNNIWQKVRAMWSYIYDNYYEKVSFQDDALLSLTTFFGFVLRCYRMCLLYASMITSTLAEMIYTSSWRIYACTSKVKRFNWHPTADVIYPTAPRMLKRRSS